MKLQFISIAAACIGLATAAQATTCTGKWGNGVDTSVRFMSGDKVKYCYGKDCWTSTVYKKGSNYLFLVGSSSASVEMKAGNGGFKATWRSGGDTSKSKLSCK